jgi:integrase
MDDKTTTIGEHPLIKRFMKGIFNLRPSLPRYTAVWDVSIVLNFFKKSEPTLLSLKHLTLRVTMLLAVLTGQRLQTLGLLKVKNMKLTESCVQFYIDELVKQSKPGNHLTSITLSKYSDEQLCVVKHLKLYIDKTKDLRTEGGPLLISYHKPHAAVTTSTIARWIKHVMNDSGVDITVFSAHSTRASSTSAAAKAGCPIDEILKHVGWSSAATFGKFYNKVSNEMKMDSAVLTLTNK